MLDHALAYAAMGWQVHPLAPRSSKPATEHGFKDATADPAVLAPLWRRSPRRNIGIRTCEASGIWVLDSDDGGEETIAALQAIHGALPPTPMQRTPSGGVHRVFAWPADGPVPRRIRFAPGLDALGERPGGKGGYFAVAPSVRDDGRYEWIVPPSACKPPPAPQWLVDMVRDAGESTRPVDMPSVQPVRSGATTPYGRKALDALASEVSACPPGSQNDTLYRRSVRAGSLAYGGSIAEREAYATMVAAGCAMVNQAGKAAWTEAQVADVVRRAFAFAALDPTPAPSKPSRDVAPRPMATVPVAQPDPPHDPETGEVIEDDAMPPDWMDGHAVTVPDHEPQPAPAPAPDRDRERPPFTPLGYTKQGYWYLPRGKGQVVCLGAAEHTKLRLIELAPLDWWQRIAPDGKLGKETWEQFANSLMRQCEAAGIYDDSRVRGRGAWVDGRRVIVHTGTEARIGDETVPLHAVASRYVYEASAPWAFGFGDPATGSEAHRLADISSRLTWDEGLSAALMAGWCVIAPVSGALPWRSHIWITGPSGAGKSTVVDIINRVVGPAALRMDGKTTEAAIRQRMGYDARPVILDETEAEDQQAAGRMQGILDLARVASTGGEISKGGSNHRSVTFIIRSCFCFSSINTSVKHRADESRISRLALRPNTAADADAHYQGLVRDIDAWLTDEFASRLFARTIRNLPTLLHNAGVFTSAAAVAFRSRRAADQIGPMLAGYYLLHKTDRVTLERAGQWIASQSGWSDYLAIGTETDEQRLLQYIIGRKVKVYLQHGAVEMTIGSAIDEARAEADRGPHRMALGMVNIKVADGLVAISDSAQTTRDLFRDAPQWSADWKRPLRMLPGAFRSHSTERFPGGGVSRATWLPYGLIDGSYVPTGAE